MKDNNYEAKLVIKAKSGDNYSLNLLADLYYNKIFKMAFYRTSSKSDAQDLTQDIFLQMVKSINSLKDNSQFKSWLYKIAINKIMDHYRKKKILSFFGTINDISNNFEQIDKTDIEQDIIKKEFLLSFKKYSNSLSKWEKEVFLMRFFDELSIKEISQTLKKSESTVKTNLYRALKKFRQNKVFNEIANLN